MFEQFGHGETDVLGDLPEQNWGNVATGVKRDGCGAACAVTKLLVRTTLPHFNKAEPPQYRYNLGGL